MNPLVSFLLLLGLLFLISKIVSQSLGLLIYKLTSSKKLTIGLIAFIFLPGTIVHEFAHAAIAQILGVHVGEIELMPEVEGRHVRLGSAQIAHTDPFRNFLIGVAPFIVGMALISLTIAIYAKLEISGFWPTLLLFYILFQTGNTMFSSKKDMEGAMSLLIALVIVSGLLYLLGLKQIFSAVLSLSNNLEPFFKTATDSLLKIIAADLIVIVTSRLFISHAN